MKSNLSSIQSKEKSQYDEVVDLDMINFEELKMHEFYRTKDTMT